MDSMACITSWLAYTGHGVAVIDRCYCNGQHGLRNQFGLLIQVMVWLL